MIKSLKLNVVDYKIIDNSEHIKDDIKESMLSCEDYGKCLFNIRDAKGLLGKVIQNIKDILEIDDIDFSAYESIKIYVNLKYYDDNHLVIQGDIKLSNSLKLLATISDVKGKILREVTNNPNLFVTYEIDLVTERIMGRYSNEIKHIVDYLINHNIYNCVVEFTLYDVPCGTNRENIIIWEIRSY